jgi:hypothetical protein
MRKAITYIKEILGTNALENSIQNKELGNLPMYITQAYKLYNMELLNRELVMVDLKNEDELSILQVDKHLQLLKTSIVVGLYTFSAHFKNFKTVTSSLAEQLAI